jgi:hypothetical protein
MSLFPFAMMASVVGAASGAAAVPVVVGKPPVVATSPLQDVKLLDVDTLQALVPVPE